MSCGRYVQRSVLDISRLRKSLATWQIEAERRAGAGATVDHHVAAGLLDEAIDLTETEARTLPDFLRGKERLENVRRDIRIHACAGIGDTHHHVIAGSQIG